MESWFNQSNICKVLPEIHFDWGDTWASTTEQSRNSRSCAERPVNDCNEPWHSTVKREVKIVKHCSQRYQFNMSFEILWLYWQQHATAWAIGSQERIASGANSWQLAVDKTIAYSGAKQLNWEFLWTAVICDNLTIVYWICVLMNLSWVQFVGGSTLFLELQTLLCVSLDHCNQVLTDRDSVVQPVSR